MHSLLGTSVLLSVSDSHFGIDYSAKSDFHLDPASIGDGIFVWAGSQSYANDLRGTRGKPVSN